MEVADEVVSVLDVQRHERAPHQDKLHLLGGKVLGVVIYYLLLNVYGVFYFEV